MKRRDFVTGLGAGAVAAGLSACGRETATAEGAAQPDEVRNWKMVTTWPPAFPGLGTGAERLAEMIQRASGGRIRVRVYAAGELVPAFEIFDAVASGTAEIGHGAAYYWKGKSEAAQFFAATPFGMNAQERNAWVYHGGGWEMWKELYAPFGLVPAPGGNSGVQMGGWFNREITSLEDLSGLKMRIPGLGGEVLRRAGGVPVNLPGAEVFTALQTGTIDATEWVGPYNDLAMGLHQVAQYYYYPGWHEPGTALETIINKETFDGLPADLQEVVMVCCRAINEDMLADFTANNNQQLQTLINEHGVQLRRFPDEVIARLKALSDELLEEIAASDPDSRRVHESQKAFLASVRAWHDVSERAYFDARG